MPIFNIKNQRPASLLSILITLTIICVAAQITFFAINYKVSDLMDSLVQSSLKSDMLHAVILLPLFGFFIIQIGSLFMFIAWVWFITLSICELFNFSPNKKSGLGLVCWFISSISILCLNNYFFPDSFFARLVPINSFWMWTFFSLSALATLLAYINFFWRKRHRLIGSLFLLLGLVFGSFSIYHTITSQPLLSAKKTISQPNIIFIGLDSVRPDFISYFSADKAQTPNVDNFLKSATIFTNAYTPLARTFTAWMSILTAQYPKHSNARTNLADPDLIHADETLAKRLQAMGYETIYGTDEKRFSNITERYGFDSIIGPSMGVNDFILGGLNDFPLTNLIINSSLGHFLFPYNYANRAAAITYEPKTFLQLVQLSLAQRASDKPLFLAIHLCVSHWPFTWARDHQPKDATVAERYQSSVEAVDQQLGELLQILKTDGLLDHSLVVLLSDHGTTVGLLHDRIISSDQYQGDAAKIKWLPIFKLGTAKSFSIDFKQDYNINTSYGQGTDVLSLKQYHVLLAFKGFGVKNMPAEISDRASLLDIAPTILEFLNQPPMKKADGISYKTALFNSTHHSNSNRPLFLETGYSISEIQTNDIHVDKVVKSAINAYRINPHTGQLYVRPDAEKSVNQGKQRAILMGDWLLARYPESIRTKLAPLSQSRYSELKNYTLPAFFVIANIKSGKWGIGLDSATAKQAPLNELMKQFNAFYGDEI